MAEVYGAGLEGFKLPGDSGFDLLVTKIKKGVFGEAGSDGDRPR